MTKILIMIILTLFVKKLSLLERCYVLDIQKLEKQIMQNEVYISRHSQAYQLDLNE